MSELSRREVLGSLGTLAVAGGWIGLTANEGLAQSAGSSIEGGSAPTYTLPLLPYAYDALEPHLDAQTMKLHHDIHHNGYVQGLNSALAGLADQRGRGATADADTIRNLTNALAFHGSGHMLHTIFWSNMKKNGGGEPSGVLLQQIDRDFNGFDGFKAQFIAAASNVQGSGWGILAWEPLGKQLIALGAEKHQNLTVLGCVPLLVIDVWEHAYYLKYQNRRGDYVKNFFNVIHWDNVGERFDAAKRLTV